MHDEKFPPREGINHLSDSFRDRRIPHLRM